MKLSRPLPRYYLILATLWLVFPAASHAQLYYHYIDLGKTTLVLPNRAVHVEQVLDARPRREGIGTVHRGLNNLPQAGRPAPFGATCPDHLAAGPPARAPHRPPRGAGATAVAAGRRNQCIFRKSLPWRVCGRVRAPR
ncbi:hypothetical protein ACFQT0_23090 [Hymenobacter humi]|uniref:Uncharacterized protein n=1 Tax=Hymenobacter humi TaxID=1411620 RepID=A0ABW2U8V9_9BACT